MTVPPAGTEPGRARVEYLERGTYRQRRYRDALRILPLFATVLFFLPLFWQWDGLPGVRPSIVIIYLFGLWLVLIGLTALISWLIRFEEPESGRPSGAAGAPEE
ncbi:hypothetical protein [Salibaculum sp.]|uniref:hypothetical protein n=1 Tax=Salibaculum sp. TaxID=2855480 RepID=UPI002B48A44D|nr:hypothetical protein [Salibaculum sp.]HKL68752.1 hypothetical protein [Salibaculum sp.]